MPIVLTSLLRLLLTGLSVKEIFTFQETTAATSGYRVSTSFWHYRCPECIFVSSLAAQRRSNLTHLRRLEEWVVAVAGDIARR